MVKHMLITWLTIELTSKLDNRIIDNQEIYMMQFLSSYTKIGMSNTVLTINIIYLLLTCSVPLPDDN